MLLFNPPVMAEKTYATTDEFIMDSPVPSTPERVSLDFNVNTNVIKSGSVTSLPALLSTIGVLPDLQLYANFPVNLAVPKKGDSQYGCGDVRLGVKLRFLRETESLPTISIYPKVTVPSGNADKGLGNGVWAGRFPLWIQKRFNNWTITTGGGIFINRAINAKNHPIGGLLIQYQVTQFLMLGNEFFAQGRTSKTFGSTLVSNFGGSYFFNDHSFLAFSAGCSIAGPRKFVSFLGYGITWGP